MPVPKKRTSKSRKNIRKSYWKAKATQKAGRILSITATLLPQLLQNEPIQSAATEEKDTLLE